MLKFEGCIFFIVETTCYTWIISFTYNTWTGETEDDISLVDQLDSNWEPLVSERKLLNTNEEGQSKNASFNSFFFEVSRYCVYHL